MARVLYFDCFSGISGDMVVGAMLDAGLPFDDLRGALGSLALSDVEVGASRVLRAGISATKFTVHERGAPSEPKAEQALGHAHDHGTGHDHTHGHDQAHHEHGHGNDHESRHAHRALPEILAIVDRSALSPAGREQAKTLFRRLAETEASIHQMPVEQVHLHEVGAIDSIVDIVGAVYAMEWAGAERVVCSPLNVGGGMVDAAHGHYPVPAPATLRLLTEGHAPMYSGKVQKELVTPTGALIATSYASSYGPLPAMTVEKVGYGAGDRNPHDTPNVLRVLIGEGSEAAKADRVVVIECEIDDMNPQIFGVVMERLYQAGALDVFYVPVQMKKNRPGTLLTVIAAPVIRTLLADIIFQETTTIGVRYAEVAREVLEREVLTVETPLGPIRFKLAWRGGRLVNSTPEFDDCAAIAASTGRSVKEVQAIAVQSAAGLPGRRGEQS